MSQLGLRREAVGMLLGQLGAIRGRSFVTPFSPTSTSSSAGSCIQTCGAPTFPHTSCWALFVFSGRPTRLHPPLPKPSPPAGARCAGGCRAGTTSWRAAGPGSQPAPLQPTCWAQASTARCRWVRIRTGVPQTAGGHFALLALLVCWHKYPLCTAYGDRFAWVKLSLRGAGSWA